jgi:hypothetical protein
LVALGSEFAHRDHAGGGDDGDGDLCLRGWGGWWEVWVRLELLGEFSGKQFLALIFEIGSN